jgi:hypothetical protein
MTNHWKVSALALVLFTSACAPMSAAYRIEPTPRVSTGAPRVLVSTLEDIRPDEEKTGAGAGMFNKSTRDSLFEDKVPDALTLALVDELRARGLDAVTSGGAPYRVTGELRAYRAIIIPPRTAFIPYVSYVTWMWSEDRISAGVDVHLDFAGPDGTLWKKPFSLSENTDAWVGVAGIASTARRLDNEHLVKILRAGAQNVLGRAADEIARSIYGR